MTAPRAPDGAPDSTASPAHGDRSRPGSEPRSVPDLEQVPDLPDADALDQVNFEHMNFEL